MVVNAVVVSEARLVGRLVLVKLWLQSVVEQASEEFVEYWNDGYWAVVAWKLWISGFVDDRDGGFFPLSWWRGVW